MSNLQTYYHFKLDFQKVDQHTGGKWLIIGSKRLIIWVNFRENSNNIAWYFVVELLRPVL